MIMQNAEKYTEEQEIVVEWSTWPAWEVATHSQRADLTADKSPQLSISTELNYH